MSFLGQLNSFYIPSFRIVDIIEILIFIVCIYKLIVGLRNTRAMILLKGILVLFIIYNIAYLFSFQAILIVFQSALALLLFALVIVFAPELRKFLEQIGTKSLADKVNLRTIFKKEKPIFKYYGDKSIVELVKACFAMGEVKTGALIVIQRDIPLTEYVETGIEINGDITSALLINTFEKNTPLHDGAVIQIKDKMKAATCYLPLSENPKISKNMGTRHRAAIGVSEVTDCLVIVVSEETGSVSMAVDGKIRYNLTKEELTSLLYKYQIKKTTIEEKAKKEKISFDDLVKQENFTTKVISAFVGIFIWMLLINVSNPIITIEFDDIPIEFINTNVIESTGKTFELVSESTVTVKVTDRRSIVDKLKKGDITVLGDMTKLSYVNAVPLNGFVDKYSSVQVEIVGSDSANIQLDSIISKEVDIEINKICSEDSKTFVPILNSEIDTILISGGKTLVDTVDKVVFTYDVSNAVDVYEGVAAPMVYDRNGKKLDNSFFDFNVEELKVTGEVYNVKMIPLNINVYDDLEGYSISSISFEPREIKVAGNQENLDKIAKLSIMTDINITSTGLTKNQLVKTVKVSEHLPDGIYLVNDNDEIKVTLTFEKYKEKEIKFNKNDIKIIGETPENLVNILDSNFSINISGEVGIIENITKETLIPYIDITGLEKGEYNLIIQFSGLENVVLESPVSAKLEIEEV